MNNEKQHTDIIRDSETTFSNLIKKVLKMEYGKSVVFLLNLMGWTSVGTSMVLAWINVDPFTQTVISLFGLVFLFIKILNGFESWYHKRCINREIRKREKLITRKMERESVR